MASTHALKARVKGVESIRQITKSMKMVSASKLRKVQEARGALRSMADRSRDFMELLSGSEVREAAPLLRIPEKRNSRCYVIFVGNRGLCGVYNSSLLKYLEGLLSGCECENSVVVCGSWGQELMEGAGLNVIKRFADMPDVPRPEDGELLSTFLKELFLSGQADEIVLVYQHFYSVMRQQPESRGLLPVGSAEKESGGAAEEYLFEPDRGSVLAALSELYVSSNVFSAMLEARIGEHAARMTSMSSAADSTDELLAKLRQELNHARQAAITTEISEIVGGAQALNGGA